MPIFEKPAFVRVWANDADEAEGLFSEFADATGPSPGVRLSLDDSPAQVDEEDEA